MYLAQEEPGNAQYGLHPAHGALYAAALHSPTGRRI
jgi:hypothetical protein